MLTLLDCMDDPKLFEPWFSGPSWAVWKAVLKAAFAIPMTTQDRELFESVAERAPPTKRVRELWVIAGRRAGKDSIASGIAAWSGAFRSYEGKLRPGETANIMCLACDRPQARVVLGYTKAFFERIKILKTLVKREHAEGLELSTGAELSVLSANFRSVRGRSIAVAVMDELAFWRDETSVSPDTETYAALVPGLSTIDGMIIGISSPHRRAGLLYEKWRDHYGQDSDNVLVIRAPSIVLNPTLDQAMIDERMAEDPAVGRAEWHAEWRDDLATYLQRELIEDAVDTGVVVRPPIPGVKYHAFTDPSGGVSDSFALGIAHAEGEKVLLDCLVEVPSPFNPTIATGTIASTIKSYGLSHVIGDRYAASWTIDAFAKNGVRYTHSQKDRSEIYSNAMPLFTSGRARLLNLKVVLQLAGLERRAVSGGRDRIDHPKGAHDDLAHAAAGALVLAASQPPAFKWTPPISVHAPRWPSGDMSAGPNPFVSSGIKPGISSGDEYLT